MKTNSSASTLIIIMAIIITAIIIISALVIWSIIIPLGPVNSDISQIIELLVKRVPLEVVRLIVGSEVVRLVVEGFLEIIGSRPSQTEAPSYPSILYDLISPVLSSIVTIFTIFVYTRFRKLRSTLQESEPVYPILYKKISDHFNVTEIKLLCFELDIDYEEIHGENKIEKVIELIGYCKRRGRIQELTERVRRHRPHISWP